MNKKLANTDKQLWKLYTKTITPLGEVEKPNTTPKIIYTKPPSVTIQDVVDMVSKDVKKAKTVKKKTDKVYDVALDLHGKTLDEAHKYLETQLCMHKMRGNTCVLVITGKGTGKGKLPEGVHGVLKRHVPMWMDQFKIVKSWSPASARDGGEGAIYVYL